MSEKIRDPFMYKIREELSLERLTDLTIAFINENSQFGSNLEDVSVKVACKILDRFAHGHNAIREWNNEN